MSQTGMVSRAVIGAQIPWYLLQSSTLDWPLMLWVKWPFVDRIYPQSNKFGVDVENNLMAALASMTSRYLLVFAILHYMRSS